MLRARFIEEMKSHGLVVDNHYTWDMAELLEKYRPLKIYVLTREPRERIASHYLQLRRTDPDATHALAPEGRELYELARSVSIADFCNMVGRADVWGSVFNRQARALSSYRAGRVQYEQIGERAFLENVLENIQRADYVADLDDIDEFARLVSLSNGWLPPGKLGVLNAGGHDAASIRELADRVPEELVLLDRAVHEAVKAKYRDWRSVLLTDLAVRQWIETFDKSAHRCTDTQWEVNFEGAINGINFHGREGSGQDTFRWMGPDCESRLFVPVRLNCRHRLSVFIVAFIDQSILAGLTFHLGGRPASAVYSQEENCTVATFDVLPETALREIVELRIKAPWTSSEAEKGTGTDRRLKSLAVKKIRVTLTSSGA